MLIMAFLLALGIGWLCAKWIDPDTGDDSPMALSEEEDLDIVNDMADVPEPPAPDTEQRRSVLAYIAAGRTSLKRAIDDTGTGMFSYPPGDGGMRRPVLLA